MKTAKCWVMTVLPVKTKFSPPNTTWSQCVQGLCRMPAVQVWLSSELPVSHNLSLSFVFCERLYTVMTVLPVRFVSETKFCQSVG